MYEYDVKFLNWDKFNPKLRNKNAEPNWCRFDADIFSHPALRAVSPHKQLLFMFLLSRVIKRSGVGQVTSKDIHHFIKLKHRDVMDALTFWQDKGIIEFKFSLIRKQTADRQDRQTDKTDCITAADEPRVSDNQRDTTTSKGSISPGGSARPMVERIDYNLFLELWNSKCGRLPRVNTLSDERKRKLRARLIENEDLAYWENCIVRMANSAFCVEGKWATFDWLIKNGVNHVKVSEGNYDNKRSGPTPISDRASLMAELQKIADDDILKRVSG